ncbi:uncharacterized protein LOC131860169 [Cryptomeria japonica]|uniref:uncharacterized protein LOC131860169 n=1 Tax=Cryptomeria japonica TaxID=3369 RepID=UPI0027D9E6C3|nr:uncharacterized protein LOC131860169 [Cryptomeria japonica]
MLDKLKRQSIPIDFYLDLLKKMQGLKQAGKSVKEYIEEFYRILITIGRCKANKEKVVHYINGLKPSIQEELSLVRMSTIEDAYQFSLKVEEKVNMRFESKKNGKGRGGKIDDSNSSQNQRGNNSYHPRDQNNRDKRGRGRGPRRGGFRGTCFQCGEGGHRAYDCPQHQRRKNRRPKGNVRVTHVDEDAKSSHSEDAKKG